jgi:hypothetical protein
MDPEDSLSHSQVPATCLYLEPAQVSPYPQSNFLKIRLNIILPSTPGFTKWSLSFRFAHQDPLYASSLPLHATCPTHLNLLYFITRTKVSE